MNITKDGQLVGEMVDTSLITKDSDLKGIYALLRKQGMKVLEPGKDGGDLEKYIPVSTETMGLLAKTLEGFGYEVEMKKVKAGGVGSGRHPDSSRPELWNTKIHDPREYNPAYDKIDPRLRSRESAYNKVPLSVALERAATEREKIVLDAYGTPGHSGRKPGSGKTKEADKGLNKWKPMQQEIKQAHKDPKQRKLPLKGAEVINSPELDVVSAPTGPGKSIKKVGTNFCVVSSGTDKNFGCYNSREQAQAVLEGRSFIEPNMPDGLKAEMGEPMAGGLAHSHMEPELWFHPPSEKRPRRVPTDDPQEKDDRFLDVTKRGQAQKDRMKRLKRSAPAGLPALIPAHTTLVSPHTATYQPAMGFSSIKAARTKDKRMRVSFDKQGCI